MDTFHVFSFFNSLSVLLLFPLVDSLFPLLRGHQASSGTTKVNFRL